MGRLWTAIKRAFARPRCAKHGEPMFHEGPFGWSCPKCAMACAFRLLDESNGDADLQRRFWGLHRH